MFFREIQTLVNVAFLITVRFALESHAPAGPHIPPYRAGDFHLLLAHQPVRFRERDAGIVICRVVAIRFALFFRRAVAEFRNGENDRAFLRESDACEKQRSGENPESAKFVTHGVIGRG